MLHAVTDRQAVRGAQRKLAEEFSNGARRLRRPVSFRPATVTVDVYWHADLGIWGSLNPAPIRNKKKGRFWNLFGTQDPTNSTARLHIRCEVNPAHQGISSYVAGLFACDERGHRFLVHNGRIGGGKRGVGRELFWKHWRGAYERIEGMNAKWAVVAELESPHAACQIAWFVKEVERIRTLVT